jgi:uncharacterized protein YndB with AHSA1/START domain
MRDILILAGMFFLSAAATAQPRPVPSAVYAIEFGTRIAGTPEEVFDLATGDIRPWWDHTFSPTPLRLYIELRPGGGSTRSSMDGGTG